MKNRDPRVLSITQGAVIAALYVALTLIFAPISFGPVQVRIAEALCILPMFRASAASFFPLPGPPTSALSGRLTSLNQMLPVSEVRSPSFCSGSPRGYR